MEGTGSPNGRRGHIPDTAIFDLDLFNDAGLRTDPHERIRELIRTAPEVFWTPRNGGHWVCLRHEHASYVLHDTDSFSSALISAEQKSKFASLQGPGAVRIPELTPALMDPPTHGRFRQPLQRAFAPRMALALKVEIARLAEELIDSVAHQGYCDFIEAVAEPLPVRTFLKMMGLPEQRLAQFRVLARELFAGGGTDPQASGRRIRRIADAMLEVIQHRRLDPQDDLISRLWAMEIDGEPMTLELMEDYTTLLFVAGLDTVGHSIGYGMRHLAMNPQLQQLLRANPERVPEAVEELLRSYTFTIPVRRVLKDTKLAGRSMKTDEFVFVCLPAADLDAARFASPERFDLARENKLHLAFGAGPHRCVGAHLARVQLQTLFGVVLRRLPPFRLDPDEPIKFYTGNILGIASLPLRWAPQPR